MFQKLLDLYCKYQNDYVKHDDNLPEQEIEFIFELTASFMKHIVRVAGYSRCGRKSLSEQCS